MLTDIDKEFDTPIEDENGELIENIETEEVFDDVDNTEPTEQEDYNGEEDDVALENEDEEFDDIQEVTVEAKENYENAKEQLVAIFTSILEKGEITAEDNVEIEQVKEQYSEAYNSIKENTEVIQNKALEERVQELEDGMVASNPDEILAILTDNGRKPWLYTDEDNNVLMDGTAIPELTVLAQKLSLIATDGDDESSIVLTPTMIQMIAESDIQLSAKKILINGLLEGKGWRVTEEGILDIKELNAVKATIGTLNVGEVIANIIHGNTADIGDLTADIGKIETLVGGNLTMDNIASLILTSKKVTVEDAFIKNAMIDSVSAAKINTGILNTNLVNIQSEDGSLVLNGTLQQFKDQNGKVRIQMGKDAQGNFTFGIFDSTGVGTLIDSNGITEKAIGDGLIVNDMINNNANISGSKLDINSVVTSINNGSSTIKGTKIKLDEQNQTLDIAFNTLNTTITNTGKTVTSQGTSIETMQGKISTLITNTTITEDGKDITIKDAYSSLKQDVGEFGVSLKSVESDFNNLTIGTRNLLSNSAPTSLQGYALSSSINWKYELIDCSSSTKEKSIKVTNLVKSAGGVYTIPIKSSGIINGEYYTVSVMIRSSSGILKLNIKQEQMVNTEFKTIGTEWTLVSFTSKVDTSKTNKGVVLYAETNSVNVGDWFEFHSLMLEKSTKPSNYTEAPEDMESSINSLGTRVKDAETKLTLDGLTTIIKDSYITPNVLNNKGYATTSDVTQSATNLIAKFSQSGGYNLLYNGNLKNDFKYWNPTSGSISGGISTTLSCPENMTGFDFPGQLGKTIQYYQEFEYDKIVPLTFSMWTYRSVSGSEGTTNPYNNVQISINYTDGTWSYHQPPKPTTSGVWEKVKYTIQYTKRPKKIMVSAYNRDTTYRMYYTNLMLEEGEIDTGFTPHPSEAYDGIIDMGRDGIKVSQSNYGGYTNMRADGLYVNDGKGSDVIKCNSDGLYVKGQIHVTSGSISEEALAGTIIDGQYIKTGTINARSVRIGDFTNYLTAPTNYTTVAKYPAYLMSPSTGQIFVTNEITYFVGGEKFLVTGDVYASASNGGATNFNFEFCWRDENDALINATKIVKSVSPNTQININDEITIPARPANAHHGDFKVYCGNSAYTLVYSRPCMRLMYDGSLIIDGSITANELSANSVTAEKVASNAILTKHLAIGDFTNYCPVTPDNCTQFGYRKIVDTTYGDWIQFDTLRRDISLGSNCSSEYSGNVAGTYRVSFTMSSSAKGALNQDGTNINFLTVGIGLFTVNNDGSKGYYVAGSGSYTQADANGSVKKYSTTITIPETAKSFGLYLQHAGWTNFSGVTKLKDIVVNKMMSGSLIVDGAIDGKIIRGAEIIGGEIKSIKVNEEGNPIFSLSSDGNITGFYIDCIGLNVEGDISADTLSINGINNSRYPQALDEDITVYINASVISDEEMFDNAKFSCMEDLFAVAPRNLNGYTIFIIFETDYTGNVNLSAFNSGSCYLYLQKHTIRGYISCYGKSMRYAIYGNTRGNEGGSANCANIKPPKGKSMSGYAYSLICDYTTMTAYDLNIYPGVDTSITPSGIIVTNLSNAYLNNINAVGKPQHLVRSHSTSQVYIAESSGLSSGNTFSAVSGSIQCLNPVNQAGSSIGKPTYTSGNAQIFSSGVTFAQADNSGSNDSGSSTTEVTTVTLKANSGDTYRRTVYKSWKKDGTVRQGDYGYGDCDGFWFFGSQISNYTSKNITKVAITIKRNTGAGSSSPVTHTLVGHGYSSRPSGAPSAMGSAIRSSFNLSQGNSVTLNLTAAEIAIFKKYKGIGLKSPYSSSYYSSCSASCTVKITYEE